MKLKTPAGIKVEDVTTPISRSRETVLYVTRNGQDIGLLTKFKDTRTDKNPWKAFGPLAGDKRPIKGFFYGQEMAPAHLHLARPLEVQMDLARAAGLPTVALDRDHPLPRSGGVAPVAYVANPRQAALALILG